MLPAEIIVCSQGNDIIKLVIEPVVVGGIIARLPAYRQLLKGQTSGRSSACRAHRTGIPGKAVNRIY
jgi:hypothetical protein